MYRDAVLDDGGVSSDRDDARRTDDRPGTNVEATLVEVALDDFPFEVAFRQRPRPVRAGVVGDVKAAVDVEDGEGKLVGFHFARLAREAPPR